MALIPARGGSKRLVRKNIVEFCGKPLIAWTIEAARQSELFDRVIVSTDDREIAEVAIAYGAEVPFVRPSELASDEATTLSVVKHALANCPSERVFLLQPTSPFRSVEDILAAHQMRKDTARSVISLVETKPWIVELTPEAKISRTAGFDENDNVTRLYAPNGAIYAFDATVLETPGAWWHEAVGYVMPPERSLDIDTDIDLEMALAMARFQSNLEFVRNGK